MTFKESSQVISCPLLTSNEEEVDSSSNAQSEVEISGANGPQLNWFSAPALSLFLFSNPIIELPTIDIGDSRASIVEAIEHNASTSDWTMEEILDTSSRLQHFEEDWNAPGMELYDEM